MRAAGLALVALLLTGCRLPYDLPGISGVAPYDGGFLVSDQRFFEGSVGLWYVEDGRATDLPGCSTGSPRLARGWVWWVTSACLESGDLGRSAVHRARPDGSRHTVCVLRLVPGAAMFVRVDRYLTRFATIRSRHASGECAGRDRSCDDGPGRRLHGVPAGPPGCAAAHGVPAHG